MPRNAARVVAAAVAIVALSACAKSPEPAVIDSSSTSGSPAASASSAADSAGWRPLFDGTTLAGWHVYHKTGTPANWRIADGVVEHFTTTGGEGGDLVTDDSFANFELALDWKISEGGNSGIIYRIADSGAETYETGPEMQILDDAKHPDGKSTLTSAGSDYALYPAARGVVKPAGEWNAVRLVVNGNHVEHWMNGVKVVEYELHSPDWNQKVAASKFKQWPGYGQSATGRIGLQEHGGQVSFRDVRIKVLP
jgi:hypothetical protein